MRDARFYDSREWREKLRPAALRRDRRLCVACLRRGRLVRATDVDHVVPISAGGSPRSMDNLQSLCASCHSHKTGAEKAGRLASGCDADGFPFDPRHPWSV